MPATTSSGDSLAGFGSIVFAQIRFLVVNLNKKNQQSTVAELNQLVNLYGLDARVFLISCLVDETDFRDSTKSHAQVSVWSASKFRSGMDTDVS